MWEVIATKNGKVRTKVVTNWKHGMQLARRAMDLGWKISIIPFYMDFLVANREGEFTRVVVRVSPQSAARYAVRLSRSDRNSGCLLWPHGHPLPVQWTNNS